MTSKRFDAAALAIVRRAYARQMLAVAGCPNESRLEDAFASVRREDFLGPPPWSFSRGMGYEALLSDDPAIVYQDILFALAPERGVNNGSPSLHARWLGAAALKPGDRVAHLGAGAGYYTAIIAELVGRDGKVDAVEVDPALADRAQASLEGWPQVGVQAGDALVLAGQGYDCIYVNFAVERPVRAWTDALAPGGRLIFPLGVARSMRGRPAVRHSSHGAGFLIERQEAGLAVRWLGGAWFICAEGDASASDTERERVRAAFERGGAEFVNSLHWDNGGVPERNWCSGDGWRLSYDPVAR
ncbi:MAG: protein-L-isoaspartate O-methyltransferase family protein [Beijerinckiaceae bacterium]